MLTQLWKEKLLGEFIVHFMFNEALQYGCVRLQYVYKSVI